MRQVSNEFNELYKNRGKFEYRLTFPGGEIDPGGFWGNCEWIDGYSDGDEFCVGNSFMGSFSCTLHNAENLPSVSDTIKAYMRITDGSVYSEWVLIGTYRVMEVTRNRKTRRVSYKCYDNMWYLDQINFMDGAIPVFPLMYKDAVQRIRDLTGVPIADIMQTVHLIDRVPPDMTCRAVLSYMLMLYGANARCDPEGQIIARAVTTPTTAEPVIISEFDYDVLETEHPPITGVQVQNRDGVLYDFGDNSGHVLRVYIPWANHSGYASMLLDNVMGYVNVPFLISKGLVNPAIEPWDRVKGRVSGQTYKITYLRVNGSAMPRTDVQNGVWEQFELPGTTSDIAYGNLSDKNYNIVALDHLPSQAEVEAVPQGSIVHVYDPGIELFSLREVVKTYFKPPYKEPEQEFFLTVNSGEDSSFTLPTQNTNYDWIVDWGDGVVENHGKSVETSGVVIHYYPDPNTEYEIRISPKDKGEKGWFETFNFVFATGSGRSQSNRDKAVLINGQMSGQMFNDVEKLFGYMMFEGCTNLTMGKTFQLPQEITGVGESFGTRMFAGCPNLKMNEIFQLPQSIANIGNSFCTGMFQDCTNLKMNDVFQLPQDIVNFGTGFCINMFAGCTNLEMNDVFQLPQGIYGLSNDNFCTGMFASCANLKMNDVFQLPQGITSGGNSFCAYMFYGCTNLEMNDVFQLPQEITDAGYEFCTRMFSNCENLKMNRTFQLPRGVKTALGYFCAYMFSDCTNLEINDVFQLPQEITDAGDNFCAYMFQNCTAISEGVQKFFGGFVLSDIMLNRTYNYYKMFYNCAGLAEPLFDIPQLQEIPNSRKYTFQECPAELIAPLHENWK